MENVIYTLHERGAVSHFYGLEELARSNRWTVKHREINQLPAIKQLVLHFNFKVFVNILFFLSVPFMSKKKIVVGVAPYDRVVPFLMWLLKKHEVYYFTSYTCWDQTMCVHSPNASKKLMTQWRYFTSEFVKHIFAVSSKTKDELVKNGFSTAERISVVYHSLGRDIEADVEAQKTMKFISVGRLVPAKGIDAIIDVFRRHPECEITFVGNGALREEVEQAALKCPNIKYAGYIGNFSKLVEVYKEHSFVLMNSQRLPGSIWEELFGMAIIEGMASGCVPVATDHTGPKEIIQSGVNGVIFREKELEQTLLDLKELSNNDYIHMRYEAIKSAEQYQKRNIAKRWGAVLQ